MKLLRNMLVACLLSLPLSVQSAPPVNINTADSQMLVDELVGVGPHKAMAIIRYRQENGPFQNIDDLTQVSGIGPSTLEQNRARVVVELPEEKETP